MLVSEFLFFSGMKVHCDVLWLFDMYTLPYAALSMVDIACTITISEDKTSEDTGKIGDAVWLIASTGVLEVFLVEAEEL